MMGRVQADCLARAATTMPVVTVMGPRQSGKTTLVKATFPDHAYLSLELPEERSEALQDPVGLLARFPDGAILDEVQRAPELLSYLQVEVDRDDRAGRWVLTGSQNLLLMRSVSQTLAGRTALFTLLPLSLSELHGRSPLDLGALDRVDQASLTGPPGELWQTLWAGFYPRIHDRGLEPRRWLADYHRTYVERDLRDVLRVMDLVGFERFVRLAAARTGQELNVASLAADAGISQPTAAQWLSALQTSYLIALVQPYHKNYRKRLRKRPKLHFLDSGLACYLLDIRSPEILQHHPLRGAIFESFVAGELIKASVHRGEEPALHHWRDATGHEIDLIVELGERQVPVEVKSGLTVADDALAGLQWWTDIADNPNRSGVLVHGGTVHRMRGNFCVRPWWIQ